jgi:predicted naringenin-chalcone synthase
MKQGELLAWTASQHATEISEKLFALGTGEDKIQKRGFQIPDPLQEEGMQKLHTASLRERMDFYEEEVSTIFEAFYPKEALVPEQLIHVTCTGYIAPSPAQRLLSMRKATKSFATHVYHMGCYASIPAVRMASGSLTTGISSVDIVHTELCSLHFHPFTHKTEQLVIQTLFADGFIKYSVQHENTKGLKLLALLEETIPGSLSDMQWRCEDTCHAMTLSKKVPLYIMQALPGFFFSLVEKAGLDAQTIRSSAYFAIHPGGTKIFHYVKERLGLESWQVAHSLNIFQQYGNMSSATLPHIWEKMLNELPKDAYIVSFAYGPGLTMVGALLRKL